MLRLVLGFFKGAIIGGAVGYGAYAAGLGGQGWSSWLLVVVVGALVGFLVGRPFWSHLRDRHATIWTPLLKAIFGAGVAAGLYALAAEVWGGTNVTLAGETANVVHIPYIFGAAIGAVYGAFVEIDDAEPAKKSEKPTAELAE